MAHTHCRPTKVTDPSAQLETNQKCNSPTLGVTLASRPHLRITGTNAVDQAVAGAAAAADGSFCLSRPHGQQQCGLGGGRGPPAES